MPLVKTTTPAATPRNAQQGNHPPPSMDQLTKATDPKKMAEALQHFADSDRFGLLQFIAVADPDLKKRLLMTRMQTDSSPPPTALAYIVERSGDNEFTFQAIMKALKGLRVTNLYEVMSNVVVASQAPREEPKTVAWVFLEKFKKQLIPWLQANKPADEHVQKIQMLVSLLPNAIKPFTFTQLCNEVLVNQNYVHLVWKKRAPEMQHFDVVRKNLVDYATRLFNDPEANEAQIRQFNAAIQNPDSLISKILVLEPKLRRFGSSIYAQQATTRGRLETILRGDAPPVPRRAHTSLGMACSGA